MVVLVVLCLTTYGGCPGDGGDGGRVATPREGAPTTKNSKRIFLVDRGAALAPADPYSTIGLPLESVKRSPQGTVEIRRESNGKFPSAHFGGSRLATMWTHRRKGAQDPSPKQARRNHQIPNATLVITL